MGKNLAKSKITFYFCDGGSCRKAGSEVALRTARAHLRNKGLWDNTHTIKTRCNGRCEDAPTWIVQKGNYWYKEVDTEKAIQIINAHCDLDKPLTSALIFQEGQGHMQSDNERPPISVPLFKLAEDATLGAVYKVRGFHSDQYLYPLFLYLCESPGSTKIHMADGKTYPFSELQQVDYSAPYHIKLRFGDTASEEVTMVIALIPSNETETLKKLRISICEYLVQLSTGKRIIRMQDKIGRLVAEIHIGANDSATWEYCLKIQLKNALDPTLVINE